MNRRKLRVKPYDSLIVMGAVGWQRQRSVPLLVERDQLDYTVMAVPEDSVTEKSLVFRYVGVQCMTLQEARKQEGE